MKYRLRLPTSDQYGFIEVSGEVVEGTEFDEVLLEYQQAMQQIKGGQGVGMKKLAEIIIEYCKDGAITDGGNYDFSANESALINEVKKVIRKDK